MEREVYRFGEFRLDLSARRLTRGAEELSLPPKAFEMLRLLVLHSHRAMTRTELLDAIWRDAVVEEGSLSWNVSVLRKTLGDDEAAIVQTVRGYGYRLGVPVERELAKELPAPEPASDSVARPVTSPGAEAARDGAVTPPELADIEPARAVAARKPGRSLLVLTAAAALALLVALLVRDRASRVAAPAARDGHAAGEAQPTLAVLPFENLSARPENAWIATALSELLANELALGGGAATIPGESVATVARDFGLASGSGLSRASVERLRARLGFDLLVTGSYLAIGEPPTLRVDFRLQEADGAATRFVGSEQAAMSDLPRLISRAGAELRRQLGGEAAGPAAPSSPLPPAAALRLYAEALELKRAYKPAAARARLAEALELAPEFVIARAALAEIDADLGYTSRALAGSRRALAGAGALSPLERLPIEARNLELEGRWAEAAAKWREVVVLSGRALEPTLSLARAESRAGRHDAARALLVELAARPAPIGTDPRIVLERGWIERNDYDFAAMRAAGKAGVELGRALPSDAVLAEALSILAWAELTLDTWTEGLATCTEGAKVAERAGNERLRARFAGLCGWMELNLDRPQAAERWFESSLAIAEGSGELEQQGGALRSLASIRAGEGRLESAVDLAQRGLALGREAGALESQLLSLALLAQLELRRARLESAEALALEALSMARSLNTSRRIAVSLELFGAVRRLRGDPSAALAAAEEALRVAPPATPIRAAVFSLGVARAALAAGQPERALAAALELEKSHADEVPPKPAPDSAIVLAGRAEVALGRKEAARKRLAELDRRHREPGAEAPDAQTLVDLAALQLDLGLPDTAAATWRRILAEERYAEEALARLEARYRLAAASGDQVERAAATRAAEASRYGALVGRTL